MKLSDIFLYLGVALLLFSCTRGPVPFNEAQWRKRVENQSVEKLYAVHFKYGKYFDPWMSGEDRGFWRFLKWKLSPKAYYTEEEKAFLPKFVPDLKNRIKTLPAGDFIAWIGHGTFLMRLQGSYWITDPMFSQRAFLPKRATPPAITVEELKEIASELNVLISHNHYDHLDENSIRSLPENTRFFVPLGLKEYVASLHKGEVRELDWWQENDAG